MHAHHVLTFAESSPGAVRDAARMSTMLSPACLMRLGSGPFHGLEGSPHQ